MARATRKNDWGFPRWRGYGSERGAARVRLCDRVGCDRPGDCPAPKAPNSPERWYFCQEHAGEYNKGWDYFAGLSAEEAAARAGFEEAKAAWRRLAKANHPDVAPDDAEAAARFREVQAAWDVLRQAEERRTP